MKKIRFVVIFACVVFMGAGLVYADADSDSGGLDLQDAIVQAQDHNPQIQKLKAAADETAWKKLEALSGYMPHLSVGANQFLWENYARMTVDFEGANIVFPEALPQTTIDLNASMVLFDGFTVLDAYQAADLDDQAAQKELEYASFKLDEQVKLMFLRVLAAQELAKVTEMKIKTLQDHLEIAKASEDSGEGTRFDVLRIEEQLEEAKAEKELAYDNIILAKDDLKRVMGSDNDVSYSVKGELPAPDAKVVRAELKQNLSEREDLKAQAARQAAMDKRSTAASGFWVPRVSVFIDDQYYQFGNFDPLILPNSQLENSYTYGFALTWNLFDGGASLARSVEAGDAAKQALETTREARLRATSDFDLWKRRYSYNTVLYRAKISNVVKSEENIRLARLGLRAGTKTHSEVLDAESDLFLARAGVVHAQMDAAEALINLELAIGKRLK